MKLELSITPVAAFPKLDGPHKLAWQYLLDTIFAEAYHAGVGKLNVSVPSEALVPELELRAELTPALGNSVGIAMLGATMSPPPQAQKAFTLAYGSLAPKALRTAGTARLEGWQLKQSLYVLTWQVKALGLPMNLLNQWRAPHLADPAMFAMRGSFARSKSTPSYYRLCEWTP